MPRPESTASTTFTTGAQRPLLSANRAARHERPGDGLGVRGRRSIDVYSRACTNSSVGREPLRAASAAEPVGLSPFDMSHVAPADGFELFDGEHGLWRLIFTLQSCLFSCLKTKRTAWEES